MKGLKNLLFIVVLLNLIIPVSANIPLTENAGQPGHTERECEACIQIAVESRSPTERPAYLTNAFDQVVNKAANSPSASEKPEILKAKANVLDYVMWYQYVAESDPLTPESKKLFLKVQFSNKAIQKLLQQAKLIASPVAKQEVIAQKEEKGELQKNHNSFSLVIENVEEAADYKEVLNYLLSFDAVSDIQIVQLASPQVTFDITVTGGPAKLAEFIRMGDVLTQSKVWDVKEPDLTTEEQPITYWYQR